MRIPIYDNMQSTMSEKLSFDTESDVRYKCCYELEGSRVSYPVSE